VKFASVEALRILSISLVLNWTYDKKLTRTVDKAKIPTMKPPASESFYSNP